MLSTRHVAVFSRHLKSHLLWQDHDSYSSACNRHPWSEEGEREVLRTCIQLYAEAEGQSVALKTQHFPLGTESAKKSHTHSVNHGEKEIFTILPLLWDMSLTMRNCKRLFIQNSDFILFVWEEIGKGPRDLPGYLHVHT